MLNKALEALVPSFFNAYYFKNKAKIKTIASDEKFLKYLWRLNNKTNVIYLNIVEKNNNSDFWLMFFVIPDYSYTRIIQMMSFRLKWIRTLSGI